MSSATTSHPAAHAASHLAEGRPLKIVHLTLASAAGGLSRYLIDLSRAMLDRGHEVRVVGDRGAWHGQFEDAQIPYHVIPLMGGARGLWRSSRELRRLLREHRPDVMHSHYRRASLMGRLGRIGSGNRPPLLYTLHLSHIDVGGWRRWLSDFGDHTHAASLDAAQWLKSEAGLDGSDITYLPHGLATDRFPQRTDDVRAAARVELCLPAEARVACYVGRLDEPKNERWCLDAIAAAGDDVHLLVAGDGPRGDDFRDAVTRRGLQGRVHMLGNVDPLPVYRASDVLLLPSKREGFSLVCLEAMSVGVPHVRTRTSGFSETLGLSTQSAASPGLAGWCCGIDHDDFVATAKQVLNDPAGLRNRGLRAAQLVRAHFTYQQQLAGTIDLYRRLAGLREPASSAGHGDAT